MSSCLAQTPGKVVFCMARRDGLMGDMQDRSRSDQRSVGFGEGRLFQVSLDGGEKCAVTRVSHRVESGEPGVL